MAGLDKSGRLVGSTAELGDNCDRLRLQGRDLDEPVILHGAAVQGTVRLRAKPGRAVIRPSDGADRSGIQTQAPGGEPENAGLGWLENGPPGGASVLLVAPGGGEVVEKILPVGDVEVEAHIRAARQIEFVHQI